ncbi:AfsR/SARP family transcriptional regulator [Cellulomonas sp.]|uniref:AfsR/SARP family transcriptional regulator n=1 Tax=Cellulomonas sp. TaxID=40001 RepID=UPI002D3EDDB6|nr:BTAD domain-containing putative transcriptional regulator [Cellulomonas sp.]HYQ74270.1 BTAD domain-containing putative transcriptional regulator [Cellulomonas sp.]
MPGPAPEPAPEPAAEAAPAAGPLRLTVLGQVRAAGPGGALLPVTGLGANLLLALALEPRGLSTARAVDETWPDGAPASGRAALQTLVSRVRGAHPGLLASTAAGYALGVARGAVDLLRAADALAAARAALAAGDAAGASAGTGAALALWDGEPGTGATAPDLVAALAARADGLRRDLLRVRAAALLDLGDAGALAAAQDLLALAPLDDGAHLLRMRALHAAGRSTEAVAAFGAYRQRLRDALGTDPAPEVAAFHLELLAGSAPPRPAARPAPAPAPAAAPAGHGLRVAPNALIGRDADVAAVEALLGAAPVVTVLGTGGLGKTRLVQEVARRAAGRSRAVYVAELAAVRDDPDVLPALAGALQVPEAAARRAGVADQRLRPLAERVLDRLGEQPTLLVLDNCEQVLAGVATWVADVVGTLPGVQVLTTSRAPLGVPGERVHPLDPLPTRDADGGPGAAVRLFTERATAVRPGVTLPADVVERLCARLDGLPLAIELAAARTRSLTVVEVERRLSDRFALLVSGGAGTPERHRTLRAVIAWSWDLLTERQRALCRRAAVLPDGFGLPAALAVAAEEHGEADETAVLDDLDALVAQSLLRVEEEPRTGEVRYRMLETVREFGQREVRALGEEDRLRDAVLRWAGDVASGIVRRAGSPERVLLDPVGDVEHDNLVALLRRELAEGTRRPDAVLALFAVVGLRWMLQGAHEELRDVQRGVLAVTDGWVPDGDPEPAVVALAMLAGTELMFGDLRASARARLAVRRAAAGDLRPVARLLADAVDRFADPAALVRLVADARESTDLPSRRLALLASWSLAENDSDVEASIGYAGEAYHLAVDTDDPWTAVMAAVSLAGAYSQSLRPREAMDWLTAARTALAAPQITHRDLMVQAFEDSLEQVYGVTLLSLGEWDEAERVFEDVARATTDVRDAEVMSGLGLAEAERGRGEVDRGLARYRALLARAAGRDDSGPWLLVAAGACLAAHVLEGRADEPALAAAVRAIREDDLTGRAGFTDRPVLGTLLTGVGTWRVAVAPEDPGGLELLALAERIGARQDFPCGVLAPHLALAAARYGADAVERARASAAALGHGDDVLRAIALLRAAGVGTA